MLSRNREWCNKNIFNVKIYKTLKWTEPTTLKLRLATETLICLNITGWVGGSLLKCSYYDEYLACEQEDFRERYIKFKGNWDLLSGERFCRKLLSCSLTTLKNRSRFWSMSHLVSENKSIYFLIRFAQTKITLFIFWNNWVIKENESFLLVEPCSRVPKSRDDGWVSCC